MEIEAETIATNRYAPEGANAISLYTNGEGKHLTFGQLAISVSLRTASAYESQSVVKMNKMTSGSTILDEAGEWLQKVANGSADWAAAKSFVIDKLGVEASSLPNAIDTYDRRMQAVNAMKSKIDVLTQSQQEDMIDLQTLVNRRDVAYTTASNVVRSLGTSFSGNAANILNG